MKILIISHTYCASINRNKWKVLANLYPNLELKVVFSKVWPDVFFTHRAYDLTKENLKNCEFIALEAFKTGNEVLYGYYPRSLIKILRNFQPDIIHVEQGDNAFSYFQAIVLAKFFCRKAKFIFFTWINWKPKRFYKYKLFWRFIEKFNLFHSDAAFVGNSAAKTILEEKQFFKPAKILPQLGVDLEFFKYNPVKKKNTVIFFGRLVEEKGIFLLADAFNEISKQFPEWRLLFLGDGPEKKHLVVYVEKMQGARNVDFISSVSHEEVKDILGCAGIVVLPSFDTEYWKEQFGHVIIEAMAMKIPIVGSDAGEIPNVIGDTGLVFEQKNVPALTRCLKLLIENEVLREELAERGYKRVLEKYSHEAIARDTYFFWKEIFAG